MATPRLSTHIRVTKQAADELAQAAQNLGMTQLDLGSRLILAGIDRLPAQTPEED